MPPRAPRPRRAAPRSRRHHTIDSTPVAPERDDKLDERGDDTTALGFKRHFVLPGVVMAVLEIIAIVWPLHSLFEPAVPDDGVLLRIAIPVLAGAQLTWWAAVGSWLRPIYRAIQLKRRGQRLPDELALASYRGAWRLPRRALFLRTGLWIAVAVALGLFLT